jgi:glycosyltransferase involved in cell wall biosynthesis
MSEHSKISAVIITFNEQEHIEKCIRSLEGIADEIIVMDSSSTDDTVAICEELGAVAVNTEWFGFANTKNLGHDKSTYNFILSIDADEELSPELKRSLRNIKNKGINEKQVYSFNRLNNYCGQWIKYAGWYPDKKVRLFDKRNTRWEGEVHEQLVYVHPTTEQHLKGDLLHYSIKDKKDHIARIHKYNKLARKYPNRTIAFLLAVATFVKLYFVKLGFLEGRLGYQLCLISAKAKIWRYKENS